jgi:uncharacterized protein YbaR (Trm112 family)
MSGDALQTENSRRRMEMLAQVVGQLACPACYSGLNIEDTGVRCAGCGRVYPIVDGIPVLIVSEPI